MKIPPVFAVLLLWLFCTSSVLCKLDSFWRTPRSVADVVSSWIFKDKCMGELGCFNNGAPFFDIQERPLSLPPSDRETINTHFLLYTRMNTHQPFNFSNLNRSAHGLLQSTFNSQLRIKFIVPGFISTWAPDWENPLKDVLLETEDVNVFIVDWTGGDGPLYEQAVANTRVVGAEIAVFIEFLQNTTGVTPEDVHIIGHSLGAHIAGYAGKRIRNIGRITGLDPAGPYFENVNTEVRLTQTDAFLVDVIHTDAANSRFQGFGTTESIGDLDFFPNGGSSQPGCPNLGSAIWSFLKHPSLSGKSLNELMCKHHRAIELFISSLSDKQCEMFGVMCHTWEDFLEGKCSSCHEYTSHCFIMGYDAENSWRLNGQQRGNVYLNTTASPPYCMQL